MKRIHFLAAVLVIVCLINLAQAQLSVSPPQPVAIEPSSTATYALGAPYEVDALTSTATVKSSAGNIYGYFVYNPNSSVCFLEVFNTTSPTLGTTAPVMSLGIPATTGANLSLVVPIQFGTAIAVAATTASKGSSTCSTGMTVTLWYD